MARWTRWTLALPLAAALCAAPARGAILTLTVVGGLRSTAGDTVIPEPLAQESLSGTTLTQLGAPLLYDPSALEWTDLTVRITNVSGAEVLFPELLPGVSVLTNVSGVAGVSSKTNVAGGGAAGRGGAPGVEGAVSRTALDLTLPLDVWGSPASGSFGGGGGAGTGVQDNLIAMTGASGEALAAYLAGRTLLPGEWIDVPGFARITAFHRELVDARLGLGIDLPTFSSGGVTVTTGAWTGSFSGPEAEAPPSASAPEPAAWMLLLAGLAPAALGRLQRRARGEGREEGAGE